MTKPFMPGWTVIFMLMYTIGTMPNMAMGAILEHLGYETYVGG